MNLGKIFRNAFINTVSSVGVSAWYRACARKNGPLVRIVVFHDVRNHTWFTAMVDVLAKYYHVISPEDFEANRFDDQKINVLITFDDGYRSWVDVAMPVLGEYDIKGLFFLNSGLADVERGNDKETSFTRTRLHVSVRESIEWNEVRTLRIAGHTIGGHTKTHARLSELQETMQTTEITEDKARIEEILGERVMHFAYPFGRQSDFTDVSERLVREAEYSHAYSANPSFVRTVGDQFALPRLCIEDGLTPTQLKQWVEGGYDLYGKIKQLVCAR